MIVILNMEDNIEDFLKNNTLCVEQTCVCSMKCKMENLNVNLEQAANYLIQLFYKTGRKYSCTRTKIGKLLSIVAFQYALDGKKIFEEIIYKYDDCGTAIREIMDTFDKDIYPSYVDLDDQQYITDEFKDDLEKEEYFEYKTLDISVRKVIEEVFRTFGSYSPSQLGQCINLIVRQEGVTTTGDKISISQIAELKCENLQFNKDEDTSLIKYLFNTVRG